MKLSTKKIIAREFLILSFVILISGIFYSIISIKNWTKTNSIENINEEISSLSITIDSINVSMNSRKASFDRRQEIYSLLGLKEFDISLKEFLNKFDSISELRQSIYNDLKLKEEGISFDKFEFDNFNPKIKESLDIKQLTDYFEYNTNYFNDSVVNNNLHQSHKFISKRDSLKRNILLQEQEILSTNDKKSKTIHLFLISLIALFVVRYFLYAIQLSIKILKKENS